MLVTARMLRAAPKGSRWVHIGPLTPEASMVLLGQELGEERVAAEHGAAMRLGELCDWLPLLLHAAARRLVSRPSWPITALTRLLTVTGRPLEVLSQGGVDVRDRLTASLATVDPYALRVFAFLGRTANGEVAVPDLAVRLGEPVTEVMERLDALVDARLLESPEPGRYRLGVVHRQLAQECSGSRIGRPRHVPGDRFPLSGTIRDNHTVVDGSNGVS